MRAYFRFLLHCCITVALLGVLAGAVVGVWLIVKTNFTVAQKGEIEDRILSTASGPVGRVAITSDQYTGWSANVLTTGVIRQDTLIPDRDIFYVEGFSHPMDGTVTLHYKTVEGVEIALVSEDAAGTVTTHFTASLDGEDFVGSLLDSLEGFAPEEFRSIELPLPGLNRFMNITVKRGDTVLQSVPFLATRQTPANRVAFVYSTQTIAAYGDALGVRSYYSNPAKLLGAYTRPYRYPYDYAYVGTDAHCDHLPAGDRGLIRFLAQAGVAMDFIEDADLDEGSIEEYDAVILGRHNEYWTVRTFTHLKNFIERGGDLIVIGGNTAYRLMERTGDHYAITTDYVGKHPEIMDFFQDILGTFYTTSDKLTAAPYEIVASDHPLTEGQTGPLIGADSALVCAVNGFQAGPSGYETDKLVDGAKGFEIIAKGQNTGYPGYPGYGADLVLKTFPSGGRVLNVSSVAFAGTIEDSESVRLFLERMVGYFDLAAPQ